MSYLGEELVGHLWVQCKEEEKESSRDDTESSDSESSCSNEVALPADAFALEMLEMGEKKEIVVEIEDRLLAQKTKQSEKNENANSNSERAPSMENNELELCDVVEICPAPAPVNIMGANAEKGKMYRGLENDSEDEEKGRPTNDEAIQVMSTEVVTHGPVSLGVIEQQGEEDIVTPTLSLLMFNIIMPCLDIYFDTLLIQKLSPNHLGCLLVIVCALTINFSFTCLAWWRFEL